MSSSIRKLVILLQKNKKESKNKNSLVTIPNLVRLGLIFSLWNFMMYIIGEP